MTRAAIMVAVAAGLAAGTLTDLLLAAAGAATITGAQMGAVAAPLILATLSTRVRRAVVDNPSRALLALGAAWMAAPLIDQHLTGAVAVDGALADALHHLAGAPGLFAGARVRHALTTNA